jgi:hypothetical protein
MIPNICIIIQGPTNFYVEILNLYKDIEHVYWATWNDEPQQNIIAIKNSNIQLILLKKPLYKGFHNINLQCFSVFNGLKFAKSKSNYLTAIKVRSDILISPLDILINNIEDGRKDSEILFLGIKHEVDNGRKYLLDFIVAGSLERMLNFWRPIEISETGLPYPEKYLERERLGFKEKIKIFFSRKSFINSYGIEIFSLKWNNTINNKFSCIVHINTYELQTSNIIFYLKCRLFDNILYKKFFMKFFKNHKFKNQQLDSYFNEEK